jgi:hypothetical protein
MKKQGDYTRISEKIMSLATPIFSNKKYFDKKYINEPEYLQMYRLHSRICGLLAEIGLSLNFIVDINRRYTIAPVKKDGGRFQRQAESDISFIEKSSDLPIVLIDYETSDAPIYKMQEKFKYLSSFKKENESIQIISLFITVTEVQHNWNKETYKERKSFAQKEILRLIKKIYEKDYNHNLKFLLGVFYKDHLELKLFQNKKEIKKRICKY